MLPASFLASLRIQPKEQQYFTIADGSEVLFGYGMARKAIDDEEWHCPVIFGPDGQYLLGATTLEIFGLAVDPYGSSSVSSPVPRPRDLERSRGHWA